MGELGRPDLYVVARFLERLWRVRRPHGKTELQMAVRLNYSVFQRYLDWLEGKQLVRLSGGPDGSTSVEATEKGLATYATLVSWIKDTVGEDHL